MKKQLSRQTKLSRPASSTVRTNRRPSKLGSKKRIGSTLAKKSNGARQASPAKARLEKPNRPSANNNQAARNAASEKTSVTQSDAKKQHLLRHEDAKPLNGASELTNRKFNPTWLDWSNAVMATNLRTTEELMRCKSPMDLWAISSRFALKSWLNLLPIARQEHFQM